MPIHDALKLLEYSPGELGRDTMAAANDSAVRCIGIGQWVLDLGSQQLQRNGESHALNPKEMSVLLQLTWAAPNLVTTDELLDDSWPEVVVGDHVLHEVIGRLRRMLGDSARRPAYIETLRKRGYRLIAPVTNGPRREIDGAAVTGNPTGTVAMLPFEDLSPAQDLGWLANRSREVLLARLSRIEPLALVRASYPLEHYGDATLAGQRLGVHTLLRGSVFPAGESVTLLIQLLETRTGTLLWSADFAISGNADDPQIPLEAVIGIETALGVRPPAASAEALDYARYGTTDMRAYALWRQQFELKFFPEATEADTVKALELGRQAVALDPQYVMGHVGVGMSHMILARWRMDLRDIALCYQAMERAVEIDPRHPIALANLARLAGLHRDWARVVSVVEQAEPWTRVAMAKGAVQMYIFSLVNLGRREAAQLALDDIRRVLEIAPDRYYALRLDISEAIFWLCGDAHAAAQVLGRLGVQQPAGLELPPAADASAARPPEQVVRVSSQTAFLYHYAGWEEAALAVFLRELSAADREAARQDHASGGWEAMLSGVLERRRRQENGGVWKDGSHTIQTVDLLAALGRREAMYEHLEYRQAVFECYMTSDPRRVHECGRGCSDTFKIPVWTAPPYRRYVGEARFRALLDSYGVVGYPDAPSA